MARFLDRREQHQLAFPQQRDSIAYALDLREYMRRHEDRLAAPLRIGEHLIERLLHQRIESLGRLVENQEPRVGLKRLYDSEFAIHAGAVLALLPPQVAVG